MKELLEFLNKSTNEYLACKNISEILKNAGFIELKSNEIWNLKKGACYFTQKDQSSLIAFKIGLNCDYNGFNIVASHLDSPNLKIKTHGVMLQSKYTMLDTEVYGGPILQTWLDRPLSISGRVIFEEDNKLKSEVVDAKKDLFVIANAPIHLKKDITLNPQKDLLPLASLTKYENIESLIEDVYNIKKETIKGFDLSVYCRDQAKTLGINDELIMSPRIDNLECAYTTLKGFLNATETKKIDVYAAFNNEEVGSETKQGADSTFLQDVLKRIIKDEEAYQVALANSFIISADNAHAATPNHLELFDPLNSVYMNEGLVIKHNAKQLYTTDGMSQAIMQKICENAGAKYQHYANRSDIRGGSTLGAISSTHVSIKSVDIGLAQLAMHSANETAGAKDIEDMIKAITYFYSSNISFKDDEAIF